MHPMNHFQVFTEEQAQRRDELSAHIKSRDGIPHRFSFTDDDPHKEGGFNFCVLGCVHEQIRVAQLDRWEWSVRHQNNYFLIPVFATDTLSNSYHRGKAMEGMYGITIDEEQSLSYANDYYRWPWKRLARMIEKRTEAIRRQIVLGPGIECDWDTFIEVEITPNLRWGVRDNRKGSPANIVETFTTRAEAITYIMLNVPIIKGGTRHGNRITTS